MAGLSLEMRGRALVQRKLNKSAKQFADTKTAHRRIAIKILGLIVRAFPKESEPGTSKKWTELKPATLARKLKKGSSPKILQDLGRLKGGFTIDGTDARRAVVGTQTVYARAHHFGFPKRKLPKRPILPSDKVAEKVSLRIINDYVKSLVRGAN